MRTRLVALLGSVWLLLGCMGMVNGLTDFDLSIQIGENATPPADFPLTAPSNGKPAMFLAMSGDRDSINLPEDVTLDLPADVRFRMEMMSYGEVGALDFDSYAAPLLDAGFERSDITDNVDTQGADVRVYQADSTLMILAHQADEGALTVMRIHPIDTAAAPVE